MGKVLMLELLIYFLHVLIVLTLLLTICFSALRLSKILSRTFIKISTKILADRIKVVGKAEVQFGAYTIDYPQVQGLQTPSTSVGWLCDTGKLSLKWVTGIFDNGGHPWANTSRFCIYIC